MKAPFKPLIRSLAAISSLGLLLTGSGLIQAQCVPDPAGLVSWWPGEDNANDIVSGNNGVLPGPSPLRPAKLARPFCSRPPMTPSRFRPTPRLMSGLVAA